MDGLGFITYPYGGKSVVGEWKEGKEWNTKHRKRDGTLIGKFENGEWIVSGWEMYFGIRSGELRYYNEKWDGGESEDNKDFGKYEGEIKNGLPNGQGKITYHNPYGFYEGEWKDGKKHGQGTFTWSDGQKDVGEYKDGNQNGQGTEIYPNGQKYVGEFKDGKYHGQGTYIYPDGRKKLGEFREGKEWNVIGYDQNGNEKIKWVNGKIEQ